MKQNWTIDAARLLYLFLLTSGVTGQFQQQNAVPCPDNADIIGYTSVDSLREDMQAETDRIAAGGVPEPSYDFVICPGPTQITFTDNEPLIPTLNRVTIRCGDLAQSCFFEGGTEQILIKDSEIDGYPLEEVSIIGMTFSGFSGAAMTGDASESTRVNIFDSTFTVSDGNSMGVGMGVRMVVRMDVGVKFMAWCWWV